MIAVCTDPLIAEYVNPAIDMAMTSVYVMAPVYSVYLAISALRRIFWNV